MASQKLTYIAGDAEGKLHVKTSTRLIGDLEVLVRVTHSGLCGTDAHDRAAGCGLGHEGVGIVEKVGGNVKAVTVGERVGWGWQFISCGHCRECVTGYRQYCPEACGQKYGELEQGAFGNYVVKHHEFVYPIPAEIESKYAGPINCAGITVFEALIAAGTTSLDRVGIVGLGGLGHLAVMYARAFGCDVVVFSGTEDKRADAMALGATEFHVLPKGGSKVDIKEGVNVLLLCGSLPDFEPLISVLARRAAIVPLMIQGKPLVIPYMPFILPGHRLISSMEGTRENHINALKFAARHNIKPWIQEFPMTLDGLNQAFVALDSGKIRYRAVLSTELEGGGVF